MAEAPAEAEGEAAPAEAAGEAAEECEETPAAEGSGTSWQTTFKSTEY